MNTRFKKNVKQNKAQSTYAESTNKGVNLHLKYVTQEDVPLVEFMYLVFCMNARWVAVGDSGLCCTSATYFEHKLTALLVDSKDYFFF